MSIFRTVGMYHQQQNKWYRKSILRAHFEATLDLSLANLLAIITYGYVIMGK